MSGALTIGDALGENYYLNSGTIAVAGNVTASDYGYMGSAVVELTGNPAGQTIDGADKFLPNLKIAAGTNNVTFNGVVKLFGNYELASVGTLNVAGSTLHLSGSGAVSIKPGTVSYNNVKFHGFYANFSLNSGTMNVAGDLTIGDIGGSNQQINSGTIMSTGNVIAASSGYTGSATIQIAGNPAGQTITGNGINSPLPNLTIAAGTNNVTLSGVIALLGNYQLSSVGTLNVAGSTLYFRKGGPVSPGSATYNNVTFNAGYQSFDLGSNTMNVAGTLTLGGANTSNQSISSGTFALTGDLVIASEGYRGSALVRLLGNPAGQTITGAGVSIHMPSLEIAAGATTVTLSGAIQVQGSYTLTSGNLVTAGSTLVVYANNTARTFGPGGATYHNLTLRGDYTGTNSVTGSITTTGALSLTTGSNNGWHLPNPGGAYSVSVGGALSISSGSTLHLHGASLTYGSLSNSGTINP